MVSQTWIGGRTRFNRINLNRISDSAILVPVNAVTLGKILCQSRELWVSVLSRHWPAHCPDPLGNSWCSTRMPVSPQIPHVLGVNDPVPLLVLHLHAHTRGHRVVLPHSIRLACAITALNAPENTVPPITLHLQISGSRSTSSYSVKTEPI